MKFSIIIPTYDRPALLAVAVRYAMQVEFPSFEVIVSDNSSTEEMRRRNALSLHQYVDLPNFKLVHPPRVLSPPEHFEFALAYATGDYISYLTDKMAILPATLTRAADAIRNFGADIVNWANAPYFVEDGEAPSGPGRLYEELQFLNAEPQRYNPIEALRFKSACIVRRDQQSTSDYVRGKIVFGCYSRTLITRILSKSGTLFGGATHDYSAMIQGLSLAEHCVMLNRVGVLFFSLPIEQSLGSLTTTYSQRALQYFRSLPNSDAVLASLLVPGVYASVHNMVAHDYKKFLPIYGHMNLFDEGKWLAAINHDLTSAGKVWRDSEEKYMQVQLLKREVARARQRLTLYRSQLREMLTTTYKTLHDSVTAQRVEKLLGRPPRIMTHAGRTHSTTSMEEAMQLLVTPINTSVSDEPGSGAALT